MPLCFEALGAVPAARERPGELQGCGQVQAGACLVPCSCLNRFSDLCAINNKSTFSLALIKER